MWKNLNINNNLIKAETDRAVLIALPHKSDYNGYSFWHPAKLVRESRQAGKSSIGYTDEFVFRLKKYGKGKYNCREVLDEIPLAADEIEAIFYASADDYEPQEPEIYTPPRIDPENATVDESLLDID